MTLTLETVVLYQPSWRQIEYLNKFIVSWSENPSLDRLQRVNFERRDRC
ncbi:MAG: hypothetical protein ACI9QV_001214 [Methylophagaceae bacterium]